MSADKPTSAPTRDVSDELRELGSQSDPFVLVTRRLLRESLGEIEALRDANDVLRSYIESILEVAEAPINDFETEARRLRMIERLGRDAIASGSTGADA